MKRINVGTRGFVELIDVYGTDATFYRAAKVCVGKGFCAEAESPEKQRAFIQNLIKKKHMRPFEFAGILVGIRCPIFVERQLRTYRKPDIERSLRMCEPIEAVEEGSPTTEEAGSGLLKEQEAELFEDAEREIDRHKRFSCFMYRAVQKEFGCKREEARRVLTLDTLTEVASYYTVRSLFHVFDERLHPAAQSETRKYVEALLEIARELFPQTIAAYENQRKEKIE